jgi:hypothetical protein
LLNEALGFIDTSKKLSSWPSSSKHILSAPTSKTLTLFLLLSTNKEITKRP